MLCIACFIRIKSYKVDQKVVLMKILSDGFNDSFLNAFLNAGCIYLFVSSKTIEGNQRINMHAFVLRGGQ